MKSTLKKIVVSHALAFAALAASIAPVGAAHAGLQDGKLTIATEGAFRPWNFVEKGKLVGFEMDLIQDLCGRIQVKCEVVAQSFDSLIQGLNSGKFDAVIASMTATPKRQEVIAFTRPYSQSGQTFAVLADSPLAKLPGAGKTVSLENNPDLNAEIDALRPLLKGKVIGVQTSSINARLLNEYFGKDVELREYKNTDQHDLDLSAGRVDAVLASATYLADIAKRPENANVRLVGPRFKNGMLGHGSAIGLRKSDTELKARFDKALEAAFADGTIKKLADKWIGIDVTPDFR